MGPTKKRQKKDMIEGFLKYKRIKQDKGPPGPGEYFAVDKDELVVDAKDGKNTRVFQSAEVDRFGRYSNPNKIKHVNPGPGAYIKNVVEPDEILVSGGVFMSETDRTPFGNLTKKF